VNLATNYSAPNLFADEFLREEYPYMEWRQRQSVYKCAEFMWSWGTVGARELLAMQGEFGMDAKAGAQARCLRHVRQQYLAGSFIVIGWLGWIVIEAIVGLMIKWFIEWLIFGGAKRIAWFAGTGGE